MNLQKKLIKTLALQGDRLDRRNLPLFVEKEDLVFEWTFAATEEEIERLADSSDFDVCLLEPRQRPAAARNLLDRLSARVPVIALIDGQESESLTAMLDSPCDFLVRDPEELCLRLLPGAILRSVKAHAARRALQESVQRLERTERRLEEALEFSGKIIDAFSLGIATFKADGQCDSVNDSLASMLGSSKDELLAGGIFNSPRWLRCGLKGLAARTLESGSETRHESRQISDSGKETWLDCRLSRIALLDEQRLLLVVSDITENFRILAERKETKEALEMAAKDLERELAVSTQLRHEAEAANQAKSDFLAGMSHELRTPLNAIIALSEVLEDGSFGPLNDTQLEYVRVILDSGHHLLRLINDILDLAKVESGKVELELEEIAISGLIDDSLTMVKEKAFKHGLTISVELEEDVKDMKILADEVKLKQILFNLLANATKFTPDGGSISVKAGKAGSYLIISVSDTGIGIKRQDHERIFNAFEQVDSSYSRRSQGTGLGLSLIKQLVELHKGKIWVESEGPGKGSVFSFTIPVSIEAPAESDDEADAESRESPAQAPYRTSRRTVLIADDNRLTREMFGGYLSKIGYSIALAQDGEEVVGKARELRPFAILLDVMMPRKGGFDVLIELKTLAETSDIPVVIVSASDDREIGLALGAWDYLVKPVEIEEIVHSLRTLEKESEWRSS